MRLCFTLFGSRYSYGLAPAGAKPITPAALLDDVARRGFSAVEIPSALLDGVSPADLSALRQQAERLGITPVVMTSGTDPEHLKRQLAISAALGATVMGTSAEWTKFGGDRREYGERWPEALNAMRDRIAKALPEAERLGISIGLENHQDFTAEELTTLCTQLGSARFGVVFDAANGLGVAQHPVDFAKAINPHLVYMHLKDYRIYHSADGFRLVRCAVGAGVVPLAELIALLDGAGRSDLATVEIGALVPREVRVSAADFWPGYARRAEADFTRAMSFVEEHAGPADADTRTPYEKGATPQAIAAYEEAELVESIRNAARLTGDYRPLRTRERRA